MSALALALAVAVGAPPVPVSGCPCATSMGAGPGLAELRPRPRPEAYALNQAGRALYRARRWEDARAKYRAALAVDGQFLGPRLNIASSYAQEQRFTEAVDEAARLARDGFVPWAREVREAADLAPLHGRPELRRLETELDEAAAAWGSSLAGTVLFVARTEPAVRLPAAGTLYLGLAQEIFAWFPATGRYRQVTAEDGRVLAFLRFGDGQHVLYVRAGKLVRAPGQPDHLRGLTVRELDLRRMAQGPVIPVEGDVERLQLEASGATVFLTTTVGGQPRLWRVAGSSLVSVAARPAHGAAAVILDGAGVRPVKTPIAVTADCAFTIADGPTKKGPPAVVVHPPGRRPFTLNAPLGAGLGGLPMP